VDFAMTKSGLGSTVAKIRAHVAEQRRVQGRRRAKTDAFDLEAIPSCCWPGVGRIRPFRGLLLPMAKLQRPTTCIGCGEPVRALVKQGVSSGVRRRTRHVEPVAEPALRCRFDGGPDLDSDALEPYPGDVA
jgi:hypothetical protein